MSHATEVAFEEVSPSGVVTVAPDASFAHAVENRGALVRPHILGFTDVYEPRATPRVPPFAPLLSHAIRVHCAVTRHRPVRTAGAR